MTPAEPPQHDRHAGRTARRWLLFISDNSVPLILGAAAALAWANLSPGSYEAFTHAHLPWAPVEHFTLRHFVNDVLMAFFFALAGKEIWAAMLPGGELRGKAALVPVIAAVGGMAGPAGLYLAAAALTGEFSRVAAGWAVPCATDIAFSYLIARVVFGPTHPAVTFLLLLAIADDALGLIILAVFYPRAEVQPLWMLLAAAAVLAGLAMQRRRVRGFWRYLLGPGAVSWTGFALAGLHPALGLLPIIPTLPHGRGEQVHWGPSGRRFALDRFESFWEHPVEVFLGLFGLLNAGVPLRAVGPVTWLVLAALVAGKPLGIFAGGWLATRFARLSLPEGVDGRVLLTIGCAAGIGFTVALFVSTVAFPSGPMQDQAKVGALGSALAVVTTAAAARILRIRKI